MKYVFKCYVFSDCFCWIWVDCKFLLKNEIKKGVIEKKISYIKSILCFKFIYMNIGMFNIGVF